jgi:hypothetical protein
LDNRLGETESRYRYRDVEKTQYPVKDWENYRDSRDVGVKRKPSIHWIRGWAKPRAGIDIGAKRKPNTQWIRGWVNPSVGMDVGANKKPNTHSI